MLIACGAGRLPFGMYCFFFGLPVSQSSQASGLKNRVSGCGLGLLYFIVYKYRHNYRHKYKRKNRTRLIFRRIRFAFVIPTRLQCAAVCGILIAALSHNRHDCQAFRSIRAAKCRKKAAQMAAQGRTRITVAPRPPALCAPADEGL